MKVLRIALVVLVLLACDLGPARHQQARASKVPFPDQPNMSLGATQVPRDSLRGLRSSEAKIAFVSDRDYNDEIYVMDSDGTNPTNITDHWAYEWSPTWSPSGSVIAFTSSRQNSRGPSSTLFTMDADGGNQTLIFEVEYCFNPAWSPDGTRIAFEADREYRQTEINVVDPYGQNEVTLASGGVHRDPAWSPDGRQIVYVRWRTWAGSGELWVMDADGSDKVQLTDDFNDDSEPAWSPDGSKIAFASSGSGLSDIYVMNVDGSGRSRLTHSSADDTSPTWSPDGAKIAFTSDRDGNKEIYVMDADGTHETRLTNNDADDHSPAFSPGGPPPVHLPVAMRGARLVPGVSVPVVRSAPVTVEYGGLCLSLPAGGLYRDTVLAVDMPPSSPEQTEASVVSVGPAFVIVEPHFGAFSEPARLSLPYDPDSLPPGRDESEVFASCYSRGTWHRVYGEVDASANTVSVSTFHNGHWTVGADSNGNVGDAIEEFLADPNRPGSVEEAQELYDERFEEWDQAIEDCGFYVEELHDRTSFERIYEEANKKLVLWGSETIIGVVGGKGAVLKLSIGGALVKVAVIGGVAMGAIYVTDIALWTGAAANRTVRMEQAQDRFLEAEAMLFALEHPDATSMDPELLTALARATEHYSPPPITDVYVVGDYTLYSGSPSCLDGYLLENVQLAIGPDGSAWHPMPSSVFVICEVAYLGESCHDRAEAGLDKLGERFEAHGRLIDADDICYADHAYWDCSGYSWAGRTLYADMVLYLCDSDDFFLRPYD